MDFSITIFIHGTLPPSWLLRIPWVREFTTSPKGINPVTQVSMRYHNALLMRTLNINDPLRFPLESLYLYGWEGSLNTATRKKAAEQFALELEQLQQKYYTKYKKRPFTRIITHSHGGNIALYTGALVHNNFFIDELVLLACPVQEETKKYIASSHFGHIYSIHSHWDTLQVLDPQGLHNFFANAQSQGYCKALLDAFSKRPFFSQTHFPPAKKLTQVYVLLNNRAFFHIGFIFVKFFALLPTILNKLEQQEYTLTDNDLIMRL